MGGGKSLFDEIGADDLVMAFFPCIYFCENNQLAFTYKHANYKNLTMKETTDKILERSRNREHFFALVCKMFSVVQERGIRLVMENPWSGETFLRHFFVMPPTFVDSNRRLRGDYYAKPTAYWFLGCEPTRVMTIQSPKEKRRIASMPPGKKAGICGEERSMISPDYARNFICDFIIGKTQTFTQLNLF